MHGNSTARITDIRRCFCTAFQTTIFLPIRSRSMYIQRYFFRPRHWSLPKREQWWLSETYATPSRYIHCLHNMQIHQQYYPYYGQSSEAMDLQNLVFKSETPIHQSAGFAPGPSCLRCHVAFSAAREMPGKSAMTCADALLTVRWLGVHYPSRVMKHL